MRQYLYCKRIIYFRRITRFRGRQSVLMKLGSTYHSDKSSRETRLSDVYFFSPKLGLGAKVDLAEIGEESATIWEVKRFKTDVPPLGHLLQLAVGGILVEELTGVSDVNLKILYHGGSEYVVDNFEELRTLATSVITDIRNMIGEEILPPPTKHSEKCKSCEFWKICLQS